MLYSPRVSIPSRDGVYSRFLSEDGTLTQLDQMYGSNSQNVMLLVIAWTSLIADTPLGDLKPHRVINRFINRLVNDLHGTIATYSRLAHEITTSLIRGSTGLIIEPYIKEMERTPIFREYASFLDTRDPLMLRFLLSFLSFGKKLYFENSELDAIAFRKWDQVEERIGKLTLPPFVTNLRDILRYVFNEWSYDVFLPKHGPGAVAERKVRGLNAKNSGFQYDRKINYLYLRKDNIFLYNETGNVGSPDMTFDYDDKSTKTSRLKFVPKDWKTTRSICMEPIVFQWAQQAVRLWYETYLSRSLLANHVFLRDQGMNQQGSRFGSLTGNLDTVDLSAASDSVSWELVKAIFPPGVLKHLAATRTRTVELPDGEIREIAKYAPMGSALCFPVQSTVYSAIILMVSIASTLGRDWREPGCFDGVDLQAGYNYSFAKRHFTKSMSKFQPFLCYGDDIICDKRVTSNVVEALNQLGFEVNESKSYVGNSAFRESCGQFHFNGSDVSPYFFKVDKISPRISIDSLAGVIEHVNRAWDYGYLHLRKHLIQFVQHYPIEGVHKRKEGVNPILFSEDENDSFSILVLNANNSHLRRRRYVVGMKPDDTTCYRLQRNELYSIVPGPRVKRKLLEKFDNYRYNVWWRSRYSGVGNVDLKTSPATTDALGVGTRWRWTAA